MFAPITLQFAFINSFVHYADAFYAPPVVLLRVYAHRPRHCVYLMDLFVAYHCDGVIVVIAAWVRPDRLPLTPVLLPLVCHGTALQPRYRCDAATGALPTQHLPISPRLYHSPTTYRCSGSRNTASLRRITVTCLPAISPFHSTALTLPSATATAFALIPGGDTRTGRSPSSHHATFCFSIYRYTATFSIDAVATAWMLTNSHF